VFIAVWALLYPLCAYALARAAGRGAWWSVAAQCVQLVAGAAWCRAYFRGRRRTPATLWMGVVLAGAVVAAATTRDPVVRGFYAIVYVPWCVLALTLTVGSSFESCAL
jgi:tryptophan-rich sensory protein